MSVDVCSKCGAIEEGALCGTCLNKLEAKIEEIRETNGQLTEKVFRLAQENSDLREKVRTLEEQYGRGNPPSTA